LFLRFVVLLEEVASMNWWSDASGAKRVLLGLCFGVVLAWPACSDYGQEPTQPVQVIDVQLRNTDTYQYAGSCGDEEGLRITRQAHHYRVSEIRRDRSTDWDCVYVYQPAAGYVGGDSADVEMSTVGSLSPARASSLRFRFAVTP